MTLLISAEAEKLVHTIAPEDSVRKAECDGLPLL